MNDARFALVIGGTVFSAVVQTQTEEYVNVKHNPSYRCHRQHRQPCR